MFLIYTYLYIMSKSDLNEPNLLNNWPVYEPNDLLYIGLYITRESSESNSDENTMC